MGLFDRFTRKNTPRTLARKQLQSKPRQRTFAAGEVDRLTASFTGSGLSANAAIQRDLRLVRQRSRQLCMDNDYARKFLNMVKNNVVGTTGIQLSCKFVNDRGGQDLKDSEYVEQEFKTWSKPGNCSANGRQSFRDIQNLVIETVARDGECLVQLIQPKKDRWALRLRVLECDHMDIEMNRDLGNGHRIVMGVECDQFDKPLAYHLKTQHPGERGYTRTSTRIPAAEIIHIYIADRPGQMRGVPWMHTAIRRLNMLGGYEEAELVAARVGASKMGFYTSPDGNGFGADDIEVDGEAPNREYNDGALLQEAAPGTFEQLPEGVGFTTFDPQHPTAAFADFTKAVLKGAASGMNVAYNTLANDLENVNFSSIRSGVLEEREQWRSLQRWLIEQLHEKVYDRWLLNSVAYGDLKIPSYKIETKYQRVAWNPRGWDWVDPLKDTKANADGVALGTNTRADIAAAKGKDLRDIFEQLKRENEMAAEYGLKLANTPTTGEIDDGEA